MTKNKPEISLIVPCYNEGAHNLCNLRKFKDYFDKKNINYEIIVVNDGSTSFYDELIKEVEKVGAIFIDKDINKGKGYAVKMGIEESSGKYIIFTDMDNGTPIEHIDDLFKYKKSHDLVIGSRYLPDSNIVIKQPLPRRIIALCARLIIGNLLLQKKIKDSQCGFKMIRSDVAKKITAKQTIHRWGFDAEILLIALSNGYSIKEIPVTWYHGKISQLKSMPASYGTFLDILKIKKNQIQGKYK